MKKIGFIGAGNMAGALIRGLLASQRFKPDDIWVSDPVDSQVRRLKRAHGSRARGTTGCWSSSPRRSSWR